MKLKRLKNNINDELDIKEYKKINDYAQNKHRTPISTKKTYIRPAFAFSMAIIIFLVAYIALSLAEPFKIAKYDLDSSGEVYYVHDKNDFINIANRRYYYQNGVKPVDRISCGCGGKDENISYEPATVDKGYSDTISQETGVSEGDIVKVDNEYIYYVINNIFSIYQVNNGTVKLVNSFELFEILSDNEINDKYYSNNDCELFLTDTKVIVLYNITNTDNEHYYAILIYSKEKNVIEKKILNPGKKEDSRVIDDMLYVVSLNRGSNSTIMPSIIDGNNVNMYDYTDIMYTNSSMTSELNFVFSLNTSTYDYHLEVLFSSSNPIIYMNNQALYIVTYCYIYNEGRAYSTIYKYSINDGQLEFSSAGIFAGTIKDQWSLSEYNGYLRVVATDRYAEKLKINRVIVLQEQTENDKKYLKQVGILDEGIGKANETVKSVLFDKDTVSIVTYFNSDPLYLIRFTNDTKIEIVDSYESPGYSTYLIPYYIDDVKYIIGIGLCDDRYTVKLSLYKIDNDQSIQIGSDYCLENRYYFCSALENHREILLYQDNNIVYFGFHTSDDNIFTYHLFKINADDASNAISLYYENANDQIIRMVVINDYYYTLSLNGSIFGYINDSSSLVAVN